MQWWGIEIRWIIEKVKRFLSREDNTPLQTINCFLSSNNNVFPHFPYLIN